MARHILTVLLLTFWLPYAAAADPSVKIINFTADWCPNCRILNPRLDEALEQFSAEEAVRVDIDMTGLRGEGETAKWALVEELKAQTLEHQVRYLWDWYGGFTGIAIIVASDNGEPLSCFNRGLTRTEIAGRIRESVNLARLAPPGGRRPEGPNCPPPMRPQ